MSTDKGFSIFYRAAYISHNSCKAAVNNLRTDNW